MFPRSFSTSPDQTNILKRYTYTTSRTSGESKQTRAQNSRYSLPRIYELSRAVPEALRLSSLPGSASIGDLICSPVVTSHSSASHADAGNDEGEGHCYDIPNRARDNESNKYEYTTAVFKKGNEDSEHVYANVGEDPDSKTNYEFV